MVLFFPKLCLFANFLKPTRKYFPKITLWVILWRFSYSHFYNSSKQSKNFKYCKICQLNISIKRKINFALRHHRKFFRQNLPLERKHCFWITPRSCPWPWPSLSSSENFDVLGLVFKYCVLEYITAVPDFRNRDARSRPSCGAPFCGQ